MDWLKASSTTSTRVEGCLALGISAGELVEMTGVSDATIRNWRAGVCRPRHQGGRVLDDLRSVVKILVTGGLQSEEVLAWLRSIATEGPMVDKRPLEIIATEPDLVRKVAREEVA